MKNIIKIGMIAFIVFSMLSCGHGKSKGENVQQDSVVFYTVNFGVVDSFAGSVEAKNAKGEEIVTGAKVANGEELIFKAKPTEEFVCSSWTVNDELQNIEASEFRITASKDITIKAHFSLKDFVTISLNGNNIIGRKIDYVLPVNDPKKLEWKGVFLEGRVVKLDDYAVSKFLTTYELWHKVYSWAKANGYKFANEGREGSIGTDGEEPTKNKRHPVSKVSWRDAIVWCNAYTQMLQKSEAECVYTDKDCKILKDATQDMVDSAVANMERKGFRLLTEAEWEYAARFSGSGATEEEKINADEFGNGIFFTRANSVAGAKKPAGFNGVVLDGVAVGMQEYKKWEELRDEATKYAVFGGWFCGDKSYMPQDPQVEGTAEVGSKLPNFLGLYDMSGNVWEWVFDGDDDDATKDDALYTVDGVVVNPQGKKDAKEKEKRGGSFFYDADTCVVILRDVGSATYKFDDTGFRIACAKR